MDSVEMSQNGDCINDTSTELEYSDADDLFGDPEVLPRVGDEYQVKIPTIIDKSAYLLYTRNPIDEENCTGFPRDFLMGLPIPVMWTTKDIKQETGESFGDSNDLLDKSGSSQYNVGNFDSWSDKMSEYRASFYIIVPGSSCDSWSEVEKASFLLGLYIFEKNFVQVKRFIEVKTMGNIMSYYYGKFYRSDEYKRWSCRNVRNKKCAYGQRLFSGARQQELLSRIFRHVSEECRNAMREVSKAFGDGKISLEEYVSSLKSMVGIHVLVNSVGIGKGKQDLTGISMEPSKSNQVVHTRPEIPIGKACASLTPEEIIKFLTGDFRLSKARSNDLFWEAVWPRLLARGWQSQEPKNQGGSKPSNLVFLIPGIKKFSRRKLSKGTHYFDSVTDVLSKIASEPGLLLLGDEEDEKSVKIKEECGWTDGAPERRRHCYLQPRTPIRDTDLSKFTVVDTSLNDGKNLRVRELRSLPVDTSKVRSRSDDSSDRDDSDLSTDESGSINQEEAKNYPNKPSKTISDNDECASNHALLVNGPDFKNVKTAKKKFKNPDILCEVKQIITNKKTHSRRRLKQDDVESVAPVAKRARKLSSCTRAATSHPNDMANFSVGSVSEQERQGCCSDMNENIQSQACWIQDKFSCTYSSKDSAMESTEGCPNDNSHGEKRALIDLNLPVQPDFEMGPNEPKKSLGIEEEQQQQPDNGNLRRHSTRNRPPTAKALEALANGFLTTNRRQKVKENYKSRTSRRSRAGEEGFSTNDSSEIKEGANGGNSDVVDGSSVMSEANGTRVSGL